jgi:hypothetical protein
MWEELTKISYVLEETVLQKELENRMHNFIYKKHQSFI